MRKNRWRKILLLVLCVTILTVLSERFVTAQYNIKSYIESFTAMFRQSDYIIPEKQWKAVNYTLQNGCYVSTSDDGQLLVPDLRRESSGLTITFAKACQEDKAIVLYYTEKQDGDLAYSEDKSYRTILPVGQMQCSLEFPSHWIKDLRIDLGANENDVFYIDSIELHQQSFWNHFGNHLSKMRLLLLLLIYSFIGLHFIVDIHAMYHNIYKYRYFLAACIVVFVVAFELNGSSIGMWNDYLPQDANTESRETVFGTARAIRSDEWALQTPFALSQQYTGYKYFSDIIRATPTDVEVVYGQPINSWLNIFRPYYWGYIFLPSAKGLSFYWITKLLMLFFATFELGMILTKKNKIVSALLAVCVSFSPGIQWWFTTLAIADVLIFGQIAIVSVYYMITVNSIWKKYLYSLLLAIAGGGYILVIYPPHQVAGGYVFAGLLIWVLVSHRKELSEQIRDNIICCLFAASIIAIAMVEVIYNSRETIQAVMQTVYPGNRMILGGNIKNITYLFRYIGNVFFPFTSKNVPGNVYESASMFDFFPIGIVLAIAVLRKRRDALLKLLLAIDTWLICWTIFQYPEWLAKITLLSNVQPERGLLVIGYINLLILARTLSQITIIRFSVSRKIIYSCLCSWICIIAARKYYTDYLTNVRTVVCAMALLIVFLCILSFNEIKIHKISICGCVALMFVIGGMVNPIQQGIRNISDNILISKISNLVQENPTAKWAVIGEYPMNNIPIMAGAPTVNSTNVYPQLELWEKIDVERQYEDVYNRYAHIAMELTHEKTNFQLNGPDYFTIFLNEMDLPILDVTYILSNRSISDSGYHLTQIDMVGNYYIYKINMS